MAHLDRSIRTELREKGWITFIEETPSERGACHMQMVVILYPRTRLTIKKRCKAGKLDYLRAEARSCQVSLSVFWGIAII